jgi:alkylhydroperoxidase family enzyme
MKSLLPEKNLNKSIEKKAPMPRIHPLEGREAGLVATVIQGLYRLMLGRALNPIKIHAHSSRIMLSAFLSNAILGSGRWSAGKDLVQLVRIRAAALNGCPF